MDMCKTCLGFIATLKFWNRTEGNYRNAGQSHVCCLYLQTENFLKSRAISRVHDCKSFYETELYKFYES